MSELVRPVCDRCGLKRFMSQLKTAENKMTCRAESSGRDKDLIDCQYRQIGLLKAAIQAQRLRLMVIVDMVESASNELP